ncbi:AEC family transporter [Levilactobacillus brevis]|uniref:AEC family transporter n=1 Tax=Levilactobacillus brevis TaxID=1580 RepID=UPI0039E6B977
MSINGLTGQITLMFLLMMIGFCINKLDFIHAVTADDLTRILLTIIGPALIITAFEKPFSVSRAWLLLIGGIAMIVTYIIAILMTKYLFRNVHNINLKRIVKYSSVYSNVGFLGIPLASSLFGSTGVFFAVIAMAIFNIFNWSHGVALFRSDPSKNIGEIIRHILFNPNIIAIMFGLLLFLTGIKLPSIFDQALGYVGNANTPLSMIIVGNSLGNLNINRQMINIQIVKSLVLRNLIFPIISIWVLLGFGISGTAFSVLLLMSACPVASLGVLFTLQAKGNTDPAVTLMGLSTVFSLVTIPLVFEIAGIVIHL